MTKNFLFSIRVPGSDYHEEVVSVNIPDDAVDQEEYIYDAMDKWIRNTIMMSHSEATPEEVQKQINENGRIESY